MPSKFFRLRSTKLNNACYAASLMLSMVLGIALNAQAQLPTPTSNINPSKPKPAYVRFWNMLPGKPTDTLELLLTENRTLTTEAPGNFYADYAAVPPGTYTFIIRRPADQTHPLKRLPLNLPAGTAATIMVSMKDGQPVVETINDTIDLKTPGEAGKLVLRQFAPNAHVTVAVGNNIPGQALNYGDSTTLNDLPATQLTINVRATFDVGQPRAWSVLADLTKDHHDTLLIMVDRYGHLRPQLTTDGQTDASQRATNTR